jgi:hypothetical protein
MAPLKINRVARTRRFLGWPRQVEVPRCQTADGHKLQTTLRLQR